MKYIINTKDFFYYNRKIISFIAALILAAFFFLLFLKEESFGESEKIESTIENDLLISSLKDNDISVEKLKIVDIKGAVSKPGTYEISGDMRVIDIINMAGGTLSEASTLNVNLSQKVVDEMVIVIPYANDNSKPYESDIELDINKDNVNSTGKVSINNANKEALMTISGIGLVKANAIIEYRSKNGQFKNIEDIKLVSGIGNSTFEKIKDSISL